VGVQSFYNHPMLRHALYFGLLSGLVSILLDLDHAPFIREHFGFISTTRPFHILLAILACFIFVHSYTRLRRLFNR